MHDTFWFELQGTPSVFLASAEFEEAAQAQADSLGMPGVRRVFVPHPIQDATDAEMRVKAEQAFDAIHAALVD